MERLLMHAMCKINIGLSITGKRPDGYHEIRSVMHTLGLHDVMSFELSEDITVECPGIPREENIVTKAIERCRKYTGIKGGLRVVIEKNIPLQAGLGGGSTDAACAIRAFGMLYGLSLRTDEMRRIALGVGADVPFLIEGGCALCEGIGEEITPFPAGPLWPVLVVMPPELRVDTGMAYRWMDSVTQAPPQDIQRILEMLSEGIPRVCPENAFEAYVREFSPESLLIKEELISLGAFASGLSGSGAAFYGIFRDEGTLEGAAEEMGKRYDTVIKSRLSGSSYRIIH